MAEVEVDEVLGLCLWGISKAACGVMGTWLRGKTRSSEENVP